MFRRLFFAALMAAMLLVCGGVRAELTVDDTVTPGPPVVTHVDQTYRIQPASAGANLDEVQANQRQINGALGGIREDLSQIQRRLINNAPHHRRLARVRVVVVRGSTRVVHDWPAQRAFHELRDQIAREERLLRDYHNSDRALIMALLKRTSPPAPVPARKEVEKMVSMSVGTLLGAIAILLALGALVAAFSHSHYRAGAMPAYPAPGAGTPGFPGAPGMPGTPGLPAPAPALPPARVPYRITAPSLPPAPVVARFANGSYDQRVSQVDEYGSSAETHVEVSWP